MRLNRFEVLVGKSRANCQKAK